MEEIASRGAWPEAISDGLTLPCGLCGCAPKFDFRVSEECWKAVAPDHLRLGVICLPCLDKEAVANGLDVAAALIEVQFTGAGKTVVLRPTRIVRYDPAPKT